MKSGGTEGDGMHRAPGVAAGDSGGRDRMQNLLHEAVSLLSGEQIAAVIQVTLDALLRLSGAKHGFLVLEGRSDRPADAGTAFRPEAQGRRVGLEVCAARNLERAHVASPMREFSHTLVRQAMKEGRTICLADASRHPDLRNAESVSRLKLRSVLVVPLRREQRVIGAVYLESRRASGVFDDKTVLLVESFAGLAAIAIAKTEQLQKLATAHRELQKELRLRTEFEEMTGSDPVFLSALETVAVAARSELPILIEGETGTGKELLAGAAHKASLRAAKPLVRMNCAAVPEPLLEDELFGHVKGAFTGAHDERSGLFAAAHGGTIFLDEVAEMSPGMQSKVLRTLEQGEVRKVGSDKVEKVDVRVIAATSKKLDDEIKARRFRADLYYRLKGVKVKLPPLRERKSDIPALVRRFVSESSRRGRVEPPVVTPEAMQRLIAYDYPGNVRELESIMRRAVLFAVDGRILPASLPPEVAERLQFDGPLIEIASTGSALKDAVSGARRAAAAQVEKAFLLRALNAAGGNVSLAARQTGINRSQFQQMLSRHGIRRAKQVES